MSQNNSRTRRVRKYPAHSIEDILSISEVIFSQNASLPLDRRILAQTIGTTVNSSSFTTKLAASEDYGLTKGRYRDEEISITTLGEALIAPKNPLEHLQAARTAIFRPMPFAKLNELFGEEKVPEDEFLANLIVRELKVQHVQTKEFMTIYRANLQYLENLPSEPSAIAHTAGPTATITVPQQNGAHLSSPSQLTHPKPQQNSDRVNLKKAKNIGFIQITGELQTEIYKKLLSSLSTLLIPIEDITYEPQNEPQVPDFTETNYSAIVVVTQNPPDTYNSGYVHGLSKALSHGNTIIVTNERCRQLWSEVCEEVVVVEPWNTETTFIELLQALIRYRAIEITTA